MSSLERELNDTKNEHAGDAERIAQLQRSLELARHQMATMQGYHYPGYGYQPPLPASNATTVLVFGILSLAVCAFFGPFAWHMGNAEIRKMDLGLVDASARGSAVAGKVCGIVGTCFLILSVFYMFVLFAAIAQ